MPTDFSALAAYIGVPGAMLAVALVATWRLYVKALADKDAATAKVLTQKDDEIEKLEERNAQLEARLFRVLDRGEHLADLAGAPQPPPPVRRRRSEV